jgi:hypothetical protein
MINPKPLNSSKAKAYNPAEDANRVYEGLDFRSQAYCIYAPLFNYYPLVLNELQTAQTMHAGLIWEKPAYRRGQCQ